MSATKALAATELLIELLVQAQRISAILQLAHHAQRDLTADEWASIRADNAGARRRLENAIAAAGGRDAPQ